MGLEIDQATVVGVGLVGESAMALGAADGHFLPV